jgi:hypothetical protein
VEEAGLADAGWALTGVVVIAVAATTVLVFAAVALAVRTRPTSITDELLRKIR